MKKAFDKVKNFPKISFRKHIFPSLKEFVSIFFFNIVLIVYLLEIFFVWMSEKKFFPKIISRKISPPVRKATNKIYSLSKRSEGSINTISLINLALRSMRTKRSRTFITIGGMSVGIGAIVFLVSIGYGLQRVVVGRVARLEELKQCEVSTQIGSQVKITDSSMADISNIDGVVETLPLIAVVGRVNYQNSVTDLAVYGVTSKFLVHSAIKPIKGDTFRTEKVVVTKNIQEEVSGVSDTRIDQNIGDEIGKVHFLIPEGEQIKVRSEPSKSSSLVGYAKGTGNALLGTEVWGSYYDSANPEDQAENTNGQKMSKWIKASLQVWEKEGNGFTVKGFISKEQIRVSGVLGTTDEIDVSELAELIESTGSAEIELLELASESAGLKNNEIKKVDLAENTLKEAVVNRSFLTLLGIEESQAVGKTFDISFVIVGDLLSNTEEKIESIPASYKIIGVIPDEDSAYIYVPFSDLKSLGIKNYTQLKLVVEDDKKLEHARRQVEAMGFTTSSVIDTVNQIDQLFATLRFALASVGMIALAVAALGMFNTMTVSLLERTREVGLMKAMGMRSGEVKDLFLTESMTMGFLGGLFGLGIGFIAGKLVSVLISILALSKGLGFIDISYIPPMFILVIIIMSTLVGLFTGIYPARRAKNISALNALRYE